MGTCFLFFGKLENPTKIDNSFFRFPSPTNFPAEKLSFVEKSLRFPGKLRGRVE